MQLTESSRVYVAGHAGMVGSAIRRALEAKGHHNIITAPRSHLDLRNEHAVEEFFSAHRPEFVFLAAARVGGIHANDTYSAEFLRDNLLIQSNVIHAAWKHGVTKLLFLGSSCIYPRLAPQPIREESLLSGPLESTNEAYAIAKIAGIKMCQAYRKQYGCNFISVMPTNLYGRGDNYHPENAHVLPALLRRFHEAKVSGSSEVVIWGTGKPLREFMFADDLGEACVFLMNQYNESEIINAGSGEEVSVLELARIVAQTVGFTGTILTDPSRPDGTPRKLLDSSRLNALGFQAATRLKDGLPLAYADFLSNTKSNNPNT